MKNEPTITTTHELPVRHTTQQQAMRNPLVPVARLGASGCPLGTARRVYREYVTAIPHQAAEWLGLDALATVQRWITVMVNDKIVLTSTSYLPVDTAGDTDDAPYWQNSDIDALALFGHPITSISLSHLASKPTPGETAAFQLTDDDAIGAVIRRYSVQVERHRLSAGVVILAPNEHLRDVS